MKFSEGLMSLIIFKLYLTRIEVLETFFLQIICQDSNNRKESERN